MDPTPVSILVVAVVIFVGFLLHKARALRLERTAALRALAPTLGLEHRGDADPKLVLGAFSYYQRTVARSLHDLMVGQVRGRRVSVANYVHDHSLRDDSSTWWSTVVIIEAPGLPDQEHPRSDGWVIEVRGGQAFLTEGHRPVEPAALGAWLDGAFARLAALG